MNHYNRKLYLNLAPTPTTNDQNKNISCPDICVDLTSTCPYDCYPYADDSYPISPPLLPPEPPTGGRQQQPISTLLIIIITVLAIGFLLISYYFIIVKFCKRWNPFRPPRGRHSPPQDAMNEEFLDENRGPEIDHPIWFINTIGLQQSIINSIAVFRYKKYDNLIEGTECSICLNEFLNEETLRLLPKCNHAFHVHCIDTWLRSHTNCPVCRAGIVSSVAMANHGINPIIIPVDADSERENSESGELINHSDEVRDDENRGADTNDVADFLDDHNEGTIDKSCADSKEKNGIQSVRRSVSVDSFMAADISRAVNGEEEFLGSHEGSRDDENGEGNCRGERMNAGGGSSSITEFFRKKPVRMQRSFTYSGRSKQEIIP